MSLKEFYLNVSIKSLVESRKFHSNHVSNRSSLQQNLLYLNIEQTLGFQKLLRKYATVLKIEPLLRWMPKIVTNWLELLTLNCIRNLIHFFNFLNVFFLPMLNAISIICPKVTVRFPHSCCSLSWPKFTFQDLIHLSKGYSLFRKVKRS